jgi:flagellin
MIQTAEGALNEVHSMLQRMRELALQAANDTLSEEDRKAVNQELQQLRAELNNVSSRTTFNGKKLLDGSLVTQVADDSQIKVGRVVSNGGESAHVVALDVSGAQPGKTYTFTRYNATTKELTLTRSGDNVSQSITLSAIAPGGSLELNFYQLGISLRVTSTGGITADRLGAALSTDGTNRITTASDRGSANFQVGPAARDEINVSFDKVDVDALVPDRRLTTALENFGRDQSVTNAQALVTELDTALNTVSEKRGKFGAVQNRLEHAVASLGVAKENMSAAESRIRDVDMAQEMVRFTRNQILLQAGTAMLAQANAAPQVVLQLLR